MFSMRMRPSPTLHRSSADPSRTNFYDSVVSGYEVDPLRYGRTVMSLRYRSSFFATSRASLLRVIGRRFLVQSNT